MALPPGWTLGPVPSTQGGGTPEGWTLGPVESEEERRAKERARGGVATLTGEAPPTPDYETVTSPDKSQWDKRADGSTKDMGWLGLLKRPDGKVSSEISVGVEIGGKEQEVPLMVPGLTKSELDYLMTHDPQSREFQRDMPRSILDKAIAHARDRLNDGKSPFFGNGDAQSMQPSSAAPPSIVGDTLSGKTPGEQTTARLGLDRKASADEIAANEAAAKSHEGDSWGTIATKFKERLGPLFTQAGAGLVQSLAEQGVLANPDIMATLPGNEGKMPSQIVMEERAKGLVPGQKLYATATADLEANAYNPGDSAWKNYVPQVAESVMQMIPGVLASIATRNPYIAGAAMAGQVGAQQYGESAAMGRSPEAALVDATWNGAAEAIGEEIPVGMLMKPGGKFLTGTLKTMGAEGLQEMFTQVLQTGYDKGVLHPDMTWGEALGQIRDAGIVGAAMGGTLHVAAHPLVKGLDAVRNRGNAPEAPAPAPVAPLTDDDIASPLPDAAIQAGKTAMADLLGENPETGEKIPGASPLDHLVEAPGVAPPRRDNLNPHILAGLIKRGVPEEIARGVTAGIHAESASDPGALNKDSGALGLGQWLGDRKAAIIQRYGPNPTMDQQLDFLVHELKGGDAGGAAVLGSQNDAEALHKYITAFMRPAAGAETTGDLERGMAALGRAGEGLPGITPDSGPSATGQLADELIGSVGANKESPEGMLKRVLGEDVLEPKKGERVDVTQNGETVGGTVEDTWEQGGRKGVRIKQDNGAIFDEALEDVQKYGAQITKPVTQSESAAPPANSAPPANIKGEAVGNGFHAFTPESGHIGISRADMPQIKAEHRGAMVNFLAGRGITSEQVEVDPRTLKPSQAEFSPEKVQQAKDFQGGDRAILVSADGYVVDGHHQWLAARDEGKPVRAIVLHAPIREVLDAAAHFPSASVSEQAGNQPDSAEAPQGGARLEDTTSGKGLAVIGASAEQMAAINRALPNAKGAPRKDGALVFSKKHEAAIREALGGKETLPPPDFAGTVNRDLTREQVKAAADIFDRAEARSSSSQTAEAQPQETANNEGVSALDDAQHKQVWNSKDFKVARKALGDPHRESPVGHEMVRGWMDGQRGDLDKLRAEVAKSEDVAKGVLRDGRNVWNPQQSYLQGFYAAATGKHADIRAKGGFNDTLSPAQVLAEIEGKSPEPTEHPGLIVKSLQTGKETTIQPKGTVAPKPEITVGDKLADGTPVAEAAVAARKRDYGAKNKLVTQDRAAELRARLKEKLNKAQLNAGIDPEMIALGTELAVFHVEAGVRRFTDWAKAIAADLDQPVENLRKYLRGWYNGARDMMEDHGESVAGMDTADEVGKAMRTLAEWAPAAETAQEAPAQADESVPADQRTVNAIAQRLLAGERFATIIEARKAISEITGETIKPGTAEAKRADEAIESAVVFAARKIAASHEGDPHAAYRALVDLYERQPNLAVRSSTSIEQQAYSTPVPLAYIASRRAGINQESRVYEPTAGNGALLIDARATYVTANELNADRARQLRMLYRGATVTEGDALADNLASKQFDAVIANPPFGPLKGEDGENQVFSLGNGYQTREIDHVIAIKALEKMKDDGRAVLLVGGIRKLLEGRAREDAYNGKAKREFYYRLYSEYNVTDHFTVNGDLYAKQGAQWPVDVIVIEGRGKSQLKLPAVQAPRVLNDWNALEAEVDGRSNVQAAVGEQAGNPAVEGAQSDRGDGRDRGSSGERGTDRLEQPAVEGEPGAVRERPAVGEPGSERLAEQPAGNDAAAAEAGRDRADRGASDVVSEALTEGGANARQVTYHPASEADSLDTLVPVNMQTAIGKALANLEQSVGKVDAFVADRLGYKPSEIGKYFSAEQVDALALGIANMEKGAGFIIGDQTGIGKGRVVAGIIRYAMKSGRMPIFVTEKPTLYADMYRDMQDIGIPDMLKRPVNIVMTNANEKVPLNEDGSEVLKTPPPSQHNATLNRIADGDRDGVDVLFTTYSQMQSMKGQWTARQRAIQRLADGSILIFDESHNAGGQGVDQRKTKKKSDDAESGSVSMDAPNRAEFARQIAKAAHGVFFSSATYAKRPEVMDLYASTDMRYAVADIDKLAAAISKGGIPMQQIVASMLTEAGQYVRRERSFAGVDYRTPAVPVSREAYSQFTGVLRAIQDFQEEHISDVVQGISDEIRSEAKSVSSDGSVGAAGATSTNFTSVMHNVVEQMLLSLKAEPAAARALEAIKNDQKPVITLANTMGSFLEEYAEEHSIGNGQPMPLDFRSLLHRYLDRTRRITLRKPFSSEKGEVHHITDDELGADGVAAYEAAQRKIDAMDLSDMPVSPIDYIRNRIRSAGYKVGEITGRSATLDYAGDVPTYRIRPGKESSIQGKRDAITGFNNGKIDVMILNQSGSTGLSLHASETFKDQRPRRMIIAQAERNIDTHMQMLGRVHRTGQVVLPSYDQLVAAVPAEMRPAAVLSKKMASLNANTTGARDSALTGEDVPDFMNEYGDEIAARMMEENAQLHELLGTPLKESQGEQEGLAREDAARRVTGRLMLLPLEEQEAFYDQFLSDYRDYLAQKEAAGEATLEAKTLELDAKQLDRKQIIAPTNTETPFGGGVYREALDVKLLGKPLKPEGILSEIATFLDQKGKVTDDLEASLRDLAQDGREWNRDLMESQLREFDGFRRDTLAMLDDDKKRAPTMDRLRANETMFKGLMATVHPGAPVILDYDGMAIPGIVMEVEKKGDRKNPLALGAFRAVIAVADASARMTVPFSQMRPLHSEEAPGTFQVQPVREFDGKPPLEAFEAMQREAREKRTILTGNMLAAYEHTNGQGQIVNFVRDDGRVEPGLMMKRGYNYEKEMAKQPVSFRTAQQVADWLAKGEIAFLEGSAGKVEKIGGQLVVTTSTSKATAGQYFLDSGVRAAIGDDFYKKSTGMVATAAASRTHEVVNALLKAGATFTAKTNLEAASEIVGGEEAQPRAQVEPREREGQSWADALKGRDEELRTELQRQLEQFGISDRIALDAARKLELTRGSASGQSWNGVISIALDKARDPGATLAHETVHAMRDLGLFAPAEWRSLVTAAWENPATRKWAERHYTARGLSLEDVREEAAAEHFANYWRDLKRPKSLWGRALDRILRFTAALGHAVNTLLGRPVNSEFVARLVQDKILSGEIGARSTGEGTAPRAGPARTFGTKRAQVEATAATFDDDETEERWADARKGVGGDGASLLATASAWWDDLANGFSRHWRDLPNEARFSDVAQQFRKLEAAPDAAKDASVRYLRNLVGKMDKAEYDLFSRKVVLDDLAWEAGADHQLPFGFTPETLTAERAKIDALIGQNEKLVEALRTRKAHNRQIADAMVEAGVLTPQQIKNPAYYRHMVLDYARHEMRAVQQKGPKKVKSPYWARRMGSTLDINANLLEAEFDWLQKAQIDVATADTIDWLKKSGHNIRDALRDEARTLNAEAVAKVIERSDEERKQILEAEQKHFGSMIARGFQIVQKALKADDVGDIPPHLQRAAAAIEAGTRKGDPPFALLAWMMDNQTAGAMGAGMVLKYTGLRKQWVRKLLGERYHDPDDIDSLVKRLRPEGYKAWQPREGRHFFTAKTITESALDMFVGKLAETAYPGVERDELHRALTTIRPQLVVGGDRYTMVLPNEIADTLTEFGNRRIEGMVAAVFGGIQSNWKRWVLINPRRFLKYNINNMSGDLDAIIAGNPGTLRQVKRAWGELRSAAKGEASDRYREALERGVFTSGLSINEIPDINRLSAVRHLTEDRGKLNQLTVGMVANVWRALQDSTQFRENLFRMAAYLDYVEKIEAGKPQLEIGYGASVPNMVNAVKDPKDRAALLARDLVGDYGAISVAGSWLRRYLVPFFSWMEINTRRYWRLTSNAYTTSKAKGIATGGLLGAGIATRTAATLAVRMGMVYGLMWLWNHLFFGDDEDKLSDQQKRQMHLILGTNSDGEVITLRTQGALSDVLGEFGFPDAVDGLKRWMNDQGTIGQAIKDTLKAPINRVATSVTPIFSEPIEQALGQDLWPDIFAPRVIHDRLRHLASTVNLDNEYDLLANKPSRGYGESWTQSVVYKRDPGEMAYDTSRSIAYDWLENVKGENGHGSTTPRSEALRDYRLALRYGDESAAKDALKRYVEFEGTAKGLKSSIRNASPLAPISKKDRRAFLESLTPEQLQTFRDAEQWYGRVYLGKEAEPQR